MEQKNEKQLIFFKDLIFTVLYRWKAAIIVGLIFALLLGGFAVMKNNNTVTLPGSSMTPETQHRVEQLKANQKRLEGLIEGYELYLENSPLMTIDPYACYKVGVYLYAEPAIEDAGNRFEAADMILRSYRSFFLSTETNDALAEEFGIDPLYLQSLVTYDISYDNCMGVLMWTDKEASAQAYIDGLTKLFNDYSEDNQAIPHKLVIVPHFAGPVADMTALDAQNTATQRLTNMKNELTSVETELKRYSPTELEAGSSNPLVFAIIGAFLGACIVVVCVWLSYICGSKIYNAKVLENRTGIRILGCIAAAKKSDPITRWFRKLDGRAMHTAPDAVTVNIRNLAKDAKKLLIMGNFQDSAMKELAEKLEDSGISCVVCADPAAKADALVALPECDKVVLVETCGKSRYEAVEWAIKTVEDHEKPLLGCVLING